MEAPDDPVLAEAAIALRDAGHWAEIVDAEWRVAHTTDELRLAQGFMIEPGPSRVGMHLFGAEALATEERFADGLVGGRGRSPTAGMLVAIYRDLLAAVGPWVVADTDGGRAALRQLVDPRLRDVVDALTPTDRIAAETTSNGGVGLDGSRPTLDATVIRLRHPDGCLAGTAVVQKPHIGMSTLATMAAMADPDHLQRMLDVAAAGRRPTAILFSDLEGSSSLSRRLSTERYFALGRRMTRVADRCVVEAGGITGRHVGDGVVAFFVAENFGSESAAAAAAIGAAHDLAGAMDDLARRSDLSSDDLVMRFGLHWGSTVYIGLITSAGRTEVTALGDEVNECARIEACATGGRMLASKHLVERLTADDARALDIDTGRLDYVLLGDMAGATEKARRDAPSVAVCEL